MKRFAFIFGLVLIAAALVSAGWWLGFRERYLTEAYSITTLDKQISYRDHEHAHRGKSARFEM
jgi:hypothetical protein